MSIAMANVEPKIQALDFNVQSAGRYARNCRDQSIRPSPPSATA